MQLISEQDIKVFGPSAVVAKLQYRNWKDQNFHLEHDSATAVLSSIFESYE